MPSRCRAISGSLWGCRCELEEGHALPHEATISRTFTHDWRGERETGRRIIRWPAGLEGKDA